jgi:hypothetical protein
MLSHITFVKDFYSKEEADSVEEFMKSQPHARPPNPRRLKTGVLRHYGFPAYADAKCSRDGKRQINPLEAMPPTYREIVRRIEAYAGKPAGYLNRIGAHGYATPNDGMNYHRHKQVRDQSDQSVFVFSVGTPGHIIGIRKLGDTNKDNEEHFYASHGSLYILPHSYNTTHEHAVLRDSLCPGMQIGFDCRHTD